MKDYRVYLAHILESIGKIRNYTAEGKETFFSSQLIQDAVMRNMEIIGEASKRISDDVRQRYPEIPWRKMAGLRDVLIHQYEGVNLERVWEVVERDLPPLAEVISAILPPLDQLERELAGEEE